MFTDIFIKRPVLATVISLLILVLGLRALFSLPIRQYPYTQNAIVSITTVYTGADPSLISGFITTPLEASIAQAAGIDYLTSSSTANSSNISANLLVNYDPNVAVNEINTKVNAVLNQLPRDAQVPTITVSIGDAIDQMYLGFYSDVLPINEVTDYLIRVVQPQLQAVQGVKLAEILGGETFALRAWLDPTKLAGFGLTAADAANALGVNDIVSAIGRTTGNMVTMDMAANTNLGDVEQFKKMTVKTAQGALIRLEDLGKVVLGATNYDTSVSFNGVKAVYIGIKIAPDANLLTVIDGIRKVFPSISQQLPQGLQGRIVYDSSEYVNSAIHEVIKSLSEALIIVTLVIFIFLGSMRSVVIPVIAIPLSLIGTFFMMLLLHYSVNLLTLLALVLAIGLVVDDAIIIVENAHRHMEEGLSAFEAAIKGARELANPIIAISVVLIAVYVPIGFMGGLTGALFTEFAFTLAGAVGISAIIALTLSPMMCSKYLRIANNHDDSLVKKIDRQFDRLHHFYQNMLHRSLNHLPVIGVFAAIILVSIYFLYITSKTELAPQEDQGLVIASLAASPNAALPQTQLYAKQLYDVFKSFPEADRIFQLDGLGGLNSSIAGMALKPWDQRKRTSMEIQPLAQAKLDKIAGAKIATFLPAPLPGGGGGLPVQFVIQTTKPFDQLNSVVERFMERAQKSGMFLYIDSDLKIDKVEAMIQLDHDKAAELGITMQEVSAALGWAASEGYVNYFNYSGRSYQVIPKLISSGTFNESDLLNYYIKTANGGAVPLSTIASIKRVVEPETLNHFQQLNSATISAVASPSISLGEALDSLRKIAAEVLPSGYSVDYGGQSRQYIQEGSALIVTFFFALIIIFLSLSALFESFRDPLIVLVSVPMSICGALIFISLGVGGASLNIYTEVGLVTLIGLISKHGILIVQFANDLRREGKSKREAIEMAASIRLRPILMTTAAMVLGVIPLVFATGAGAVSRFNIGLVIASGISIGTLFTLFVVPAMYMYLAGDHHKEVNG